MLMHADDVAVITESVVANGWFEVAKENGMRTNTRVGKTEVMLIARRKEECNIYMGNAKINQTANYSYLGVNIEEENKQQCEMDKRIAKYNTNVGALYPLLKEKYIPRKCKLEI